MAIQIPNPGTGNRADQTGDNEWAAMKKVADNFSNPEHAANKIVGTGTGQVPLAEQTFKAAYTRIDGFNETNNPDVADTYLPGTRYLNDRSAMSTQLKLITSFTFCFIETKSMYEQTGRHTLLQTASNYQNGGATASRTKLHTSNSSWTPWVAITTNAVTYSTTTASGANVVVDSSGKLLRSTSSERYKNILSNVVLDDAMYNKAINEIQPIVYRSTADADNSKHHFYSFSAEKVGAVDPALALWRETETVTDEDGNTTEQPLDERLAEGLNINGLLALQYAMIMYQHNKQVDLESRILKLEQANED